MPQPAQNQSFANFSSGIGLAAGALSALMFLALQLGTPGGMIFTYLSPLPLYAAGVSLGSVVVLIAAATGILITLLVGGGQEALTFACLDAAPAFWLIRLAMMSRENQQGKLEWYPQGRLAMWLSIGAAGLFGLALILTSVLGNGLWDGVAQYMDEMVRNFAEANGQEPAPALRQLTAQASTWLPAMVGVSWMTMQVINGTLAQGLAKRFGRNMRPSPVLATFYVPGAMVYALAVTLAASLLPDGLGLIARTLGVFAAFPFFFQGLAVVHALACRLAARNVLLVVFYIVLFLLGWPMLLVTGLGLIDQWVDVRSRFNGPNQNTGNDIDNNPSGGPKKGGPGGNQEEK